jgi:hypothetical protein
MSAIAVASVKYVQHTFDWDALPVQAPSSTTAVSTLETPEFKSPIAKSPVATTIDAQEVPLRRGRCEHVGSVMAAVLSKYGLGIDDLLRAIEARQAQAGVVSR